MPTNRSQIAYSPETSLWWKDREPGRAMVAVAKALEEHADHRARRRQNLRHMRLYSNRDLSSIYDCGLAVGTYDAGVYLTMNIVQSCVDTVAAKLWKTPRIQASVQDGDWSLKQRAKKLTRFADGLWYVNKWNGESRQVGVDSTLFGAGVVQVLGQDNGDDEGEVVIERVLPDEIIFDETEAICGLKHLRTIYRKRWVHRQLLLEKWVGAKKADGSKPTREEREARKRAIKLAPGANPGDRYAPSASEMIGVYEAWHLPSLDNEEEGRHIIGIEGYDDGATFFDGPWTRKRFPLSFLNWNRLPTGLMGRSLAEELVPIQLEINDLLETIHAGQNLMCVPKVFYRANVINMQTWTNAFAEMIEVNGDPNTSIMVTTPKGVSDEIYQERNFWWQHGFEVTGISMLSATAEKPEGVSSAVALRELLDREDMRLNPKGKQFEEFNVDVFENCVDEADEMAERKRSIKVQVPLNYDSRKSGFALLEWKGKRGVDMERDKYILRADAVSALPSTPQGRKQYAVELWQLGAVTREKFLQMLELPDTTSEMNLILASIENVERAMEIIVEDNRYIPPEEYADLVIARTIAMQTYLREVNEGAPERVLAKIARYIDDCVELLAANDNEMSAQATAQVQAPQPGAPTPTPGGIVPADALAQQQPLAPVPETLAVPAAA